MSEIIKKPSKLPAQTVVGVENIRRAFNSLDKYDIIEIDWLDTITTCNEWTYASDVDLEHEEKYMNHKAIGAYFGCTDSCIFLVTLFRPEDGTVSGMIGMPFSTIKKVELLKRVNGKTKEAKTKRRSRPR